MILCAEEEYFGPDEAYIYKRPIPEEERVPLSTLTDKYNLTTLQTRMFPRESIDLLQQMIPGLKEVLLIGDGRYVNQQHDYDIRRLMAQKYPDLKYRFLSAADISLEELMSLLETTDPAETGCFFSSWFRQSNIAGSAVLNANSFRVIANLSVPVSPLEKFRHEQQRHGRRLLYDEMAFETHLQQTILSVLANTPPREIPFSYLKRPFHLQLSFAFY